MTEPVLTPQGDQLWTETNGQLHRYDGPAAIRADGTREWHLHGQLHRSSGPAVEHPDGTGEWWLLGERSAPEAAAQYASKPVRTVNAHGEVFWLLDGKWHRDDGPAVIWAEGKAWFWYRHGIRHRADGPASHWPNGNEEWWIDGQLHRDDGPAIIWASGYQCWRWRGLKHRDDGPAVIHANGTEEWWRYGVRVEVAQVEEGRLF